MKHISFLLAMLFVGNVVSHAYEEHVTTWPTDGLVAHWDLHVDYQKDLVNGIKRDTTESRRFVGFQDAYVGNNKMAITLPADMWDVHKPHTILLRMVNYRKTDLEELYLQLPIRLSADDDALNFTLFHDSLLSGAQTEYELPLLWTRYSSEKTSSMESVIAVFMECLNQDDTLNVRLPNTYAGKTKYVLINCVAVAVVALQHFEQREQYQACLIIAESREMKTKSTF